MDATFGFNPITILISSTATLATTFTNRVIRTFQPNARTASYDAAFEIIKNFFLKATNHTVEEMQHVGNSHIPNPPNVRVSKVLIPTESCLQAQKVICQVLGEEDIQTLIGGSNWWTKRTISLSGEWISLKRDEKLFGTEELVDDVRDDDAEVEQERIKRLKKAAAHDKARKEGLSSEGDDQPKEVEESGEYPIELDEMSCTLALHGGGHLFGSINTHRYAFWRISRKTKGRVFAVSYRLSPQYPFPCALQDALAAYLFLIQPPPGAKHKKVHPSKITILGDSAGGGLCTALLCLIRDSNLPAPAGGVLISPWVDMTHSFPSILENTATDYIPPYSFIFKPSTLWPPPSVEFTAQANQPFTFTKTKSIFKKGKDAGAPKIISEKIISDMAEPADVIELTVDGKLVKLVDQIQLYATNKQLTSPWVSPIWQPSLGGLPPLYILAGNDEVLRDEIVYLAHRAANPTRYPLRTGLLPTSAKRIQLAAQHDVQPTQVHLQIYDLCPHDLYLFSFLKPAKYAYRTFTSFINSVTAFDSPSTPIDKAPSPLSTSLPPTPIDPTSESVETLADSSNQSTTPTRRTPKRAASTNSISRAFNFDQTSAPKLPKRLEQTIYSNHLPHGRIYEDNMIRERVSWDGIVRPMEIESEMKVLQLDKEELGLIKADAVRRYLTGTTILKKKFAATTEKIQQEREHHLLRFRQEEVARMSPQDDSPISSVDLEGENPPPSAIFARFDTRECRKLAKVLEEGRSRSGLHIWSQVQDLSEKMDKVE